jgi:hypothetical protein
VNYTHRSECHACALVKSANQYAYYSAFHITAFSGTCWRRFGGVGAVFNARGLLVCACVNRARKFKPQAGDVLGKQMSKSPYYADLDKQCTLQIGEGDLLYW